MRNIIFRYLFVEVALTWLVVTLVLLFLTLGLGLARFVGAAAAGDVPVDTVIVLAALTVVSNLQIVLPVTVLLAILLTLGRVCRDNELVAMLSGGAGLGRIYRPFFALGLGVAILAGAVTLVLAPRAQLVAETLSATSAASALQAVTPGRFRSFDDGHAVFYARGQTDRGGLRGVFIRVRRDDRNGHTKQTVVTAQRARVRVDADTRRVVLVLYNGWRYTGTAGAADYRIVAFARHGVALSPPVAKPGEDVDTQSTWALIAGDNPKGTAEWQIRASVPLSILILTLLALPIGRVPPRAGRYGRVMLGVVLYVAYVNAVRLAGVAIEGGSLPGVVGVWWVHGVVLVLAAGLVLREYGVFARWRAAARGTP